MVNLSPAAGIGILGLILKLNLYLLAGVEKDWNCATGLFIPAARSDRVIFGYEGETVRLGCYALNMDSQGKS